MRKNVGSQVICAQLVSKTDGSDVTTGTTTVYVTGDGGAQGAGGGTVAHEGNGTWSYVPTQAETNYTHIAFTFVNTSAVTAVVNVYTVGQDFTAATLASTVTTNNDKTGYALTAAYDPAKTAAQAGDAMTLANDAVTAAAIAADALAEIKAEVEGALATTARAELTGVPAANASLVDKLTWITMLLRNKRTQDDTTETVFADDGTTPIATSDKTVASGTLTRGEFTDVP